VIQVKPRGGLLGMVADASTLVDLMRVEELEKHAEDRDLIHNVGREYLDSSLQAGAELRPPVVLTPLAHPASSTAATRLPTSSVTARVGDHDDDRLGARVVCVPRHRRRIAS
jgi:hypothetical protein